MYSTAGSCRLWPACTSLPNTLQIAGVSKSLWSELYGVAWQISRTNGSTRKTETADSKVLMARYDNNIGIISRIKINSEATLICVYNSFFLHFYCLLFLLCRMNNDTDISQSGLPPEWNGLHDSWSSRHLVLFCPKQSLCAQCVASAALQQLSARHKTHTARHNTPRCAVLTMLTTWTNDYRTPISIIPLPNLAVHRHLHVITSQPTLITKWTFYHNSSLSRLSVLQHNATYVTADSRTAHLLICFQTTTVAALGQHQLWSKHYFEM